MRKPKIIKNGADLIAAERKRQITKEGYKDAHDDDRDARELARAALSYVAGALIAAEIDRLQRQKGKQ